MDELESNGLVTAAPMSAMAKLSVVLMFASLTCLFAMASWYLIDSFLDHNAGECIGPVCIHGPP